MKWILIALVILSLCGCEQNQSENKNKSRAEALGIVYEKTTPGFVVIGDSYGNTDTVKEKK